MRDLPLALIHYCTLLAGWRELRFRSPDIHPIRQLLSFQVQISDLITVIVFHHRKRDSKTLFQNGEPHGFRTAKLKLKIYIFHEKYIWVGVSGKNGSSVYFFV